jgi:hypothetical protein
MASSDCLVVKIDELFSFEVEHTIFIVYDTREQKYVIRGKRFENNQKQQVEIFSTPSIVQIFDFLFQSKSEKKPVNYYPYSFSCPLKESLVDFLDFIFTQGSTFRISLYNYDNFPYLSKDITYDFFERHVDESFEINSVYDYRSENKIKEKFEKILDLIQYVSNDYGKYGEEYGEEEEDEYEEEYGDEEEYGEEEYGEEYDEEEEEEYEDEKLWKKKHSRIS